MGRAVGFNGGIFGVVLGCGVFALSREAPMTDKEIIERLKDAVATAKYQIIDARKQLSIAEAVHHGAEKLLWSFQDEIEKRQRDSVKHIGLCAVCVASGRVYCPPEHAQVSPTSEASG